MAERVRVVYPPCDVDAICSNSEMAVSRKARPANERYTFLSMNRFWPEKRLDIIVEAAGKRFFITFKPSRNPEKDTRESVQRAAGWLSDAAHSRVEDILRATS